MLFVFTIFKISNSIMLFFYLKLNMKKLELNQMEVLTAGISGRGCMIMGGLAVLSLVAGLAPIFIITGAAAAGGCFD